MDECTIEAAKERRVGLDSPMTVVPFGDLHSKARKIIKPQPGCVGDAYHGAGRIN